MPFCTECGAENPRENKFCSECGSPLPVIEAPTPPDPVIFEASEEPAQPVSAPPQQNVYSQPSQPETGYTPPQQPYTAPVMPQTVEPVATGGLLAWSIVTLLLCTIPGIVALVQTLGINKCATAEEQQKKMQNAKIWCIVGTALGVLAIIGRLASGN